MENGIIKILLVDDNFIVRESIKELLSEESTIQVIAEASNGLEAIESVKIESPHLVLMDINMPEMDGIEATTIIKQNSPDIQILILSMHNSKTYVNEALIAGATGYILKNSESKELIKAIQTAVSGNRYLDSEIKSA